MNNAQFFFSKFRTNLRVKDPSSSTRKPFQTKSATTRASIVARVQASASRKSWLFFIGGALERMSLKVHGSGEIRVSSRYISLHVSSSEIFLESAAALHPLP